MTMEVKAAYPFLIFLSLTTIFKYLQIPCTAVGCRFSKRFLKVVHIQKSRAFQGALSVTI